MFFTVKKKVPNPTPRNHFAWLLSCNGHKCFITLISYANINAFTKENKIDNKDITHRKYLHLNKKNCYI